MIVRNGRIVGEGINRPLVNHDPTSRGEIEAIRADGIARANEIINKTLTTEYLQHELNLTLQKFAETGANTIVVPANMHGFNMILPTDKLTQR